MIHPKCCHAASRSDSGVSPMKIAAPKNPLGFSSASPWKNMAIADKSCENPSGGFPTSRSFGLRKKVDENQVQIWARGLYVWYMGSLSHISITASMDHRHGFVGETRGVAQVGNAWNRMRRAELFRWVWVTVDVCESERSLNGRRSLDSLDPDGRKRRTSRF